MVASRTRPHKNSLSVPRATCVSPIPVGTNSSCSSDDAKVFLREFTRELLGEISPATKILSLLIIVLLVAGGFYLGGAANTGYKTQQQQSLSLAEMQTMRMDEQARNLKDLNESANQTSQQISDLTRTNFDLKQSNQSVLSSLSLPTRLWNSYSNGICLLRSH